MDAPPIQYVKTSDGYNIAYAVTGEGLPMVLLPAAFSHVRNDWSMAANQPLFLPLTQRYRLARFDVRGHGMSTRGLPDDLSMDDYLRDLEAVVERLGLQPFVLFGWYVFWRVAVRYAARHPERITGLILYNAEGSVESRPGDHPFMALARDAWDLFLSTLISPYAPAHGASYPIDALKESQTQDDFLKLLQAINTCDVTSSLSEVDAPALIIAERFPQDQGTFIDSAQELASRIRNARLVTFEAIGAAFAAEGDNPSPFIRAVEDFVSDLPELTLTRPASPGVTGSLSSRELEVLRLLALGKGNPEIAKELFITRNTVQNHVSSILMKTNLINRAQAAVYAKEHGIV
jgi:pimeloyl-ACP methyl ester carboxylesterase/DNA-binding CsgD family transcriptional regulator